MRGYNGLYLVGNYPDPDTFVRAAVTGLRYFDFLEIGIPFSDPVADGPVITDAIEAMVEKGLRLDELLESVSAIRRGVSRDRKLYFMTYANMVYRRGTDEFGKMCRDNGVQGVIIPDIPRLESAAFREAFTSNGIEFIQFATPENRKEQITEVAEDAEGFLYFVSIRGTTGSSLTLDEDTKEKIAVARKASSVPVVLGFGIRDATTANLALENADGFIIGTRIVELLNNGGITHVENFYRDLAEGLEPGCIQHP